MCEYSLKGDLYKLRTCLWYKMSPLIYVSVQKHTTISQLKQHVILRKTSSLQGIVRLPMGLSYPNSSAALLNKY